MSTAEVKERSPPGTSSAMDGASQPSAAVAVQTRAPETRADKVRAIAMAALVHLVLVLVLLAGVHGGSRNRQPVAGPVVEAELVFPLVSAEVSESTSSAPLSAMALPESHVAETVPVQPTEQAQVSEPDVTPDPSEEVVAVADSADPPTEPDDGDAQPPAVPAAGLGGESTDYDRKLRVLALRKAMRENLWTERSHYTPGRAQTPLNPAAIPQGESPSPRNHGFTVRVELPAGALDSDALASYEAALTDLILANWVEPEPATEQVPCHFTIRQLPAQVELQVDDTCPFDEITRRSIEDAFALASPQPQPPEELWALGDAMRVVLEPGGGVAVSGGE